MTQVQTKKQAKPSQIDNKALLTSEPLKRLLFTA